MTIAVSVSRFLIGTRRGVLIRPRRVGVRPSSPDQSLTLPDLWPTFGRKLLDRERGSARHCGLNLLAHLSLGRSGTPLRGGGVLFRHAASLSGMSQLTACAISTSQGTRSGSGRGMRPSASALPSSMRFWGKVQGAGRSLLTQRRDHAGIEWIVLGHANSSRAFL